MWENYCGFADRPNSKITNCLQERFGIKWEAGLGRYQVNFTEEDVHKARKYLLSIGCRETKIAGNNNEMPQARFLLCVIHTEGNTSPTKKNLAHWQASTIRDLAVAHGRIVVVLDWDRRSPLPNGKDTFCPGANHELWGNFGSGDAATIAALISLAEAYVGIDSGPGKVASATETPTLICWKGHHPLQFHDPAPNTMHLIPADHRRMSPINERQPLENFFREHYRFMTYSDGDHGLCNRAVEWLQGVLGISDQARELAPVQFVLPNGIGDVMWALHKIQSVAAGAPIHVILSGDSRLAVDNRSVPFLERFDFIRSIRVIDVPIHKDKERPTDSRGRYDYVSDGLRPPSSYYYLIPNAALEHGRELETGWLPEVKINWDVFKHFSWNDTQKGTDLGKLLSPFVALYLGPEAGSANDGHNRGWLWEPRHWLELCQLLLTQNRDLKFCVVGAPYDRSFWEKYVRVGFEDAGIHVHDFIGKLEIGDSLALLRECNLLVSYQCGLAIVLHYLGGNVVTWWRPDGNSAHEKHLVCFDERMRHCWLRPGFSQNYIGLVYGRDEVKEIAQMIKEKGWTK